MKKKEISSNIEKLVSLTKVQRDDMGHIVRARMGNLIIDAASWNKTPYIRFYFEEYVGTGENT